MGGPAGAEAVGEKKRLPGLLGGTRLFLAPPMGLPEEVRCSSDKDEPSGACE